MIGANKKKETKKMKRSAQTVQFGLTEEEAAVLNRYAAISKVPLATMAKSGCFLRGAQLVREMEAQEEAAP